MWIIEGLLCGIIVGLLVYMIFALIFSIISATNDKALTISIIPAIIVFAFCVFGGTQIQSADMWVDFYNEDGQIAETYEITYYNTKKYGDSITFYLKDGRIMVKKDCIYNVRFEEDEVK